MSHSISSRWNSLPDVGARGSPLELSAVPRWDKIQIKAARYAETQHLKALFHLPVLWLLFTAIHFNHPVLSPSKDWVVPGIPPGFLLQPDSTHIQSVTIWELKWASNWNSVLWWTPFLSETVSGARPPSQTPEAMSAPWSWAAPSNGTVWAKSVFTSARVTAILGMLRTSNYGAFRH